MAQRWLQRLHRGEDLLLAGLLLALLLLAVAQIVLRLVFETGLVWAEPLSRMGVLWLALLGALGATRKRHHIMIDALPRLLGERHTYLAATRARVLENRAVLTEVFRDAALPVEGGWTAMLRLPSTTDEERLALRLLEAGVLVQPGYFFDAPEDGYLAVSLLVPTRPFAAGARVIASMLAGS